MSFVSTKVLQFQAYDTVPLNGIIVSQLLLDIVIQLHLAKGHIFISKNYIMFLLLTPSLYQFAYFPPPGAARSMTLIQQLIPFLHIVLEFITLCGGWNPWIWLFKPVFWHLLAWEFFTSNFFHLSSQVFATVPLLRTNTYA